LEGALGKIALNSVRNPKQLLQVNKDKDAVSTTFIIINIDNICYSFLFVIFK